MCVYIVICQYLCGNYLPEMGSDRFWVIDLELMLIKLTESVSGVQIRREICLAEDASCDPIRRVFWNNS